MSNHSVLSFRVLGTFPLTNLFRVILNERWREDTVFNIIFKTVLSFKLNQETRYKLEFNLTQLSETLDLIVQFSEN